MRLGHGRHRLPAVLLRVVRLDGGEGGLPVIMRTLLLGGGALLKQTTLLGVGV